MPPPERIGRYLIERRLGTGAFGVVWLAHDDRLEAPVAIKVMAENWAYQLDIRERFLSEARLLRKATSSGVVQVYDIGELPDERPYFVMEYADLGTLEDRLTAGPLPVLEALRLTASAARGTATLHGTGIIHRDIKPSNVLLASGADGEERVLVADLGLAKNLAQASGFTVVAGSPGYTAPEQTESLDGLDARADVYSLGALLYHLVTGTVPARPGKSVRPDELRPDLPREVQRAVLRAMETNRERRWPSAKAFADELDHLHEQLAARQAGGKTRRPRRSHRIRRSHVLIAVAVAAVAALGVGATVKAMDAPAASSVERVNDASGRISVAVPKAWAGQMVDSDWTPTSLGLTGGPAPGLIVAPDVRQWQNLRADVSGVFVGLGTSGELAARVDKLGHRDCTYQGSRAYTDASWHGRVRTWSSCGTPGHSLEEIGLVPARAGLPQVYVQIRSAGGTDRTDPILHSLRISG
ncbi:serine/threonine protein kinase [Streptomyces sp. 150FB]|uniref:serine/threonine-protein kinase n=1 Tax=Streptomyces sp. 150FB TaxID=1576605 RepID=UPI00058926EC|nr:serine/threonine-protein kinase [Streptomyces sp. 150FB]KIF77884.1 serine/threonine protein kinase [Streptomyces sp. 150FB]